MQLATHAAKLERYLGAEVVRDLSDRMRDWYGPPIAVAGVPGKVFAHRGGDFRGRIASDGVASALCLADDFARHRLPAMFRRWERKQRSRMNAGFASFADLLAEATAGKRREFAFQKVGTTGVAAVTNSLWRVGNLPAAGAAAAAAPGGTVPTSATTGAFAFDNPTGGDTQHFVLGSPVASVAGNTLLLYDRIFAVAKTMNSTATEAVTGVPTRYQSTTAGAADSAEGNFLFVEVGSALAGTAHNWTTCQYTDQGGTTAVNLPSLTGAASAIANRLDHPTSQWFAPLASGDRGIKALTQMQCSAAVATGTVDFVIGHPLAWMPCPIANMICFADGVSTAFNLVRIFDDACMAFLETTKPTTGATTYTGTFTTVRG